MIRGIIVGHGDFARAMVETAEKIVGKQPLIDVISNQGLSCEALNKKIKNLLDSNKKYESIIFIDLPGGSCSISCFRILKEIPDLYIICGINLVVLIEFFMLRDKYSARDLAPILIEKGRKNIILLKVK